MKKFLIYFFCLYAVGSLAQQPPGADIYLFDVRVKKGVVSMTNPKNISNKPGYDNQPFFHPDKPLLYYASANEEGRTDIVEYDYASGTSRKITETPEREYSPTVTPDKKFLSCIIQRDNGAQDLGKYPVDGGVPTIIIDNLTVGYHAWMDEDRLIAFILSQPFTLQLIELTTGKATVLAEHIGRSLHKIPNQAAMSFVQQMPDKSWTIKRLDTKTLAVTDIVSVSTEKEPIITWTPDGYLLRSDDQSIYYIKPDKKQDWKRAENATLSGNFSRMAMNKTGSKIAIVVSE